MIQFSKYPKLLNLPKIIIKCELVNYLETNKLLLDTQFDFRPGRSSEKAIIGVTSLIYFM
jgi:hypothetical protein